MRTKKFFKDKKLKFEFIDYDLADQAVQEKIQDECKSKGLQMSFPIVYIDDQVVQGYDPDKYEELLK
jgi:glutaredoxin